MFMYSPTNTTNYHFTLF